MEICFSRQTDPPKGDTVQRSTTILSTKAFFKSGRWRCLAGFLFHFNTLHLITCGLILLRRTLSSVRSVCFSHDRPR